MDNKLTLTIANNLVFHDRSKHIATHKVSFYLRIYAKKKFKLEFVKLHDRLTDIYIYILSISNTSLFISDKVIGRSD